MCRVTCNFFFVGNLIFSQRLNSLRGSFSERDSKPGAYCQDLVILMIIFVLFVIQTMKQQTIFFVIAPLLRKFGIYLASTLILIGRLDICRFLRNFSWTNPMMKPCLPKPSLYVSIYGKQGMIPYFMTKLEPH